MGARRVSLPIAFAGVALLSVGACRFAGAVEIGTLEKGGLHGIGFSPKPGTMFIVQATGMWGGYQDYRPRFLPTNLPTLMQPATVGKAVRETWSLASPYGDHWSARWTARLKIATEGDYAFYYSSDDGARMWVDDKRIVNDWIPRSGLTSEAKIHLAAGDHAVRCEFFEEGGQAQAHLEWAGPDVSRQVVPVSVVSADGKPGWKSEYFLNQELRGDPTVSHDEKIDFNWGDGGPDVFQAGPPTIALEWARVTDDLVLGRVRPPSAAFAGLIIHAWPTPSMGFVMVGGQAVAFDRSIDGGTVPRFRLRVLSPEAAWAMGGPSDPPSVWLPGTQPLLFLAGSGRLPDLDATTATARLERALRMAQ